MFTPVSGGSGASATPTFVLRTTATFTVSFTTTFTLTWNIPDIVIYDVGTLSVTNITASGCSATITYTFRAAGLQCYSRNSIFSDFGNPIMSMKKQTNIYSFGSVGSSNYTITLSPQTIKPIQISVDDGIATKDGSAGPSLTMPPSAGAEEKLKRFIGVFLSMSR